MMLRQRVETLAEIFNLSELVLSTALHVLNFALHNHSLWESLIIALWLDRSLDSIEQFWLTITELV